MLKETINNIVNCGSVIIPNLSKTIKAIHWNLDFSVLL